MATDSGQWAPDLLGFRWPWKRCRGTYAKARYIARCDRVKHHDGDHVADHGMDVIRWREVHG